MSVTLNNKVRMFQSPESLSVEERDSEVRALLAQGLLRMLLNKNRKMGELALTCQQVRGMNVRPSHQKVNA
jgi:hypothetical protein